MSTSGYANEHNCIRRYFNTFFNKQLKECEVAIWIIN